MMIFFYKKKLCMQHIYRCIRILKKCEKIYIICDSLKTNITCQYDIIYKYNNNNLNRLGSRELIRMTE